MASPGFFTGFLQRFRPFPSQKQPTSPTDVSTHLLTPPPTDSRKRKKSLDSSHSPDASANTAEDSPSLASRQPSLRSNDNFLTKRIKKVRLQSNSIANSGIRSTLPKKDLADGLVAIQSPRRLPSSPRETDEPSQSPDGSSDMSIDMQDPGVEDEEDEDEDMDDDEHITTWQRDVAEASRLRSDEPPEKSPEDLDSSSNQDEEQHSQEPQKIQQPQHQSEPQASINDYSRTDKEARESLKQALTQELVKRNASASLLASKGWSEEDIHLFKTINGLSLMPLLPSSWVWDFRILPDILFTAMKDDDNAPIRPTFRNKIWANHDIRGSKVLAKLFELGPLVRDDVKLKIEPHKKMLRHMNGFIRWTLEDARITSRRHGVLPNIIIYGGPKNVSPVVHQKQLVAQLADLAQKWIDARSGTGIASIPPLYGVIASGVTWGIVSYVPGGIPAFPIDSPDHFLRTIAVFNWKNIKMDVWHGFSFALLAIHCRDLLLALVDSEGLGHASPPPSPQSDL